MYSETNRIFGLDVLRALAISLVLISHCTFLMFPETTNTFLNTIRLMGAIGVDLFFVLSGYLIGGILLKIIISDGLSWSSLFNFWKRRWFRTLPNYTLILILNIALAFIVGLPIPKSTVLYGLFLQNFAWEHPNFFAEAWSLSIEEFAYLLLPFVLFLVVIPLNRNKKQLFFLTTILVIVLLTLFKAHYFLNTEAESYHNWSSSFRKVVVYRMDSIYYGFLAVYCVRTYTDFVQKNKKILLLIGLILFIGLHMFMYTFSILPETYLWFYIFVYLQAIGVLLLVMFPYVLNLKGKLYIKRIIEFVSTRSYGMYLVNYSLILLNLQLFLDINEFGIWLKGGITILFLLVTFIASNILYVYFEKPILKYRDRKFPR